LGGAFLGGVAASTWLVSMTAAVAALSGQRRRPLGFSLWIGTGIATGIAGGFVGGWLPGGFTAMGAASDPATAKRAAILAGSVVTMLAVFPLIHVRLAAPAAQRRIYPRGAPVVRFLGVFAVWQLAIGLFNPFFNAYFTRLGMPVERIGLLFAGSQFAQAAAVLAAPLLLVRAGGVPGVGALQAATAAALLALAFGPGGWWSAAAYVLFMSFQVMTEPGLFSLLMNKVDATEEGGASSLLFFVISATHAVAAVAAGRLVAVHGYAVVLAAAALLAMSSALLIRKTGGR
jgi:hypothetical protein